MRHEQRQTGIQCIAGEDLMIEAQKSARYLWHERMVFPGKMVKEYEHGF